MRKISTVSRLFLICLLVSIAKIHSFHLQRWHSSRNCQQDSESLPTQSISRRGLLQQTGKSIASTVGIISLASQNAQAAPPISVIAEELGYFPVQNKDGTVMYIPKRVQRTSTPQAIELAKALQAKGITMYGAYWCPHCSRQKELFGAEAWSQMNYVECSPKGYGFQGAKACKDVDGYPTFRDKTGKIMNVSGERPLEFLAQLVGYTSFDPSLEDEVPMAGTTCKLPKRQ